MSRACVCDAHLIQILHKLRGSTAKAYYYATEPCVCGGGGGCHIKEEGLHGSRGGRPAEGACAKKDV